MRRVRRALLLVPVALLALAALLAWLRSPIRPLAWQAPPAPGYVGPHALNTRLGAARLRPLTPHAGPEHVAVGPDGRLYTGVLDGAVLAIDPRDATSMVLLNTGGRPLGLEFGPDGALYIADALRGLLRWTAADGLRVLADHADGAPILYADAVAVGPDGWLYLSDASQRHSPRTHGSFHASALDIFEQSCTGRVLALRLADGRLETVMTGLCFPNGVVTDASGARLLIAETGRYRIWSVDARARGLAAAGADPAQARVIVDNLPGFPDNLTRGRDGRFWTGLTAPRSGLADALAGWPQLRRLLLGLPRALWPLPPARGHLIAFDLEGRIRADLQDPAGAIPQTSGATETATALYVQSLSGPALGTLAPLLDPR